jgi:hypothetical protein
MIVDHRHHDIYLAVLIQISERGPSMESANLHIGSCFTAGVLRAAIMQVSENRIGLHVFLLGLRIRNLVDLGICGEQVLIAVIIEVVDARAQTAHPHALESDPRLEIIRTEEMIAFISKKRECLTTQRSHKDTGERTVHNLATLGATVGDADSPFRARNREMQFPDTVVKIPCSVFALEAALAHLN